MIEQSSTCITKTSNLNLYWGASSCFTPSHSHTGNEAHTHTQALAVSGTFSHLWKWHSYMQHTNRMFFVCACTESVPLPFLSWLQGKVYSSCSSDPFPAIVAATVFLWKNQNLRWHFQFNGGCDGWEPWNPTFTVVNEGWKVLLEPGGGGSSCFVPEEGAVSGEAGPVQQPKGLNRSKKSFFFLHPHLLRLHLCRLVNQ